MEMLEDRIKTFVSLDYGYSSDSDFAYGIGFYSGYGYGYDENFGDGLGFGYGDGDGTGVGYGFDDGVKEVNGDTVYVVDDVPTIIKSVRANIAQGFILQRDLTLKPCYIVKEQNKFAHGDTLHDAFTALQEKLYDDSTEEERIEAFRNKFPDYDTPYSNRDLFDYHHVLTGSCRMGRESFCQNKGIDLNGTTTVREFIELTKGSYGSEIICKLPVAYGVK
nr:MAG TPA: hypothetical protein [Caudoviricetes sp.]DAQ40673.1 MAG TPA: hypothetical protein [Caudoviricetes sp.]